MESITILHLTFLHFSFQYLKQRQVIRTHIGWKVVDGYLHLEVASDEEDQKHIWRAQSKSALEIWKSISKAQCKDKYRKQFSCFHQIDISEIKIFLRCESWRYTKVGSTDQLDHERR